MMLSLSEMMSGGDRAVPLRSVPSRVASLSSTRPSPCWIEAGFLNRLNAALLKHSEVEVAPMR